MLLLLVMMMFMIFFYCCVLSNPLSLPLLSLSLFCLFLHNEYFRPVQDCFSLNTLKSDLGTSFHLNSFAPLTSTYNNVAAILLVNCLEAVGLALLGRVLALPGKNSAKLPVGPAPKVRPGIKNFV